MPLKKSREMIQNAEFNKEESDIIEILRRFAPQNDMMRIPK